MNSASRATDNGSGARAEGGALEPEMVERVARAMWQSEWDRARTNAASANAVAGRDVFVHTVPRWENCNLIFLSYARAAIPAMREPTMAMLAAGREGNEHVAKSGHDGPAMRSYVAWQAMIDAALR